MQAGQAAGARVRSAGASGLHQSARTAFSMSAGGMGAGLAAGLVRSDAREGGLARIGLGHHRHGLTGFDVGQDLLLQGGDGFGPRQLQQRRLGILGDDAGELGLLVDHQRLERGLVAVVERVIGLGVGVDRGLDEVHALGVGAGRCDGGLGLGGAQGVVVGGLGRDGVGMGGRQPLGLQGGRPVEIGTLRGAARAAAAAALVHLVEEAGHGIVVGLGDDIVFVVVALGAADRQAEEVFAN